MFLNTKNIFEIIALLHQILKQINQNVFIFTQVYSTCNELGYLTSAILDTCIFMMIPKLSYERTHSVHNIYSMYRENVHHSSPEKCLGKRFVYV